MSYAYTRSRILQWLGILLALGLIAVSYWYYRSQASTLNQSQNDLNTTGLVGLWSFNGDDISGTTAYDRSGSGNNGTLTNGPTVTRGKVSQALSFDGSDDYVLVADANSLDITGAITLSTWVKTSDTDSCILSKSSSIPDGCFGSSTTKVFELGILSSTLWFQIGNGTSAAAVSGSASGILDNQWHHVTATWDGTTGANGLKLYIDGVLIYQATSSIAAIQSATTEFLFAGKNGAYDYAGLIDETRIYNTALTAVQIQSLYTQGGGTKTNSSVSQPQGTGRLDSGLAAYYALDDGTSGATPTSAADSSTNGNTGTLTGGPTWTTGQIGSAVDFDGTDDYITVTSASVLEGSVDSMTFSGWFNRDTFTTTDTVLAKRNSTASSDIGYIAYIDATTDKLTFEVAYHDGAPPEYEYQLESTTTFTSSGWNHFAIVWDRVAQSNVALYINGKNDSATATGSYADIGSISNGLAFRMGTESDGGNPFDGKLDEVRIYGRSLSSDEISQLYRLTTPTGTDTGLKGYWSFNAQDTPGSGTYDSSGAGNTGTFIGSPTKSLGKVGQALDFDGTDDYVSIADNTSLDIGDTADLTLSGWFYRDTFTTDDTVIAKRNGIAAGDTGYIAYIDDATDQLIFEVSDGTDEYSLTSSSTFTATGWNHYAIVWDQDSAANSEIYINGLANSATDTGTIGNLGDLSNAVVLAVGAESDAGNPFDGKLDEIRVFKRTLSTAEIKNLYDVGTDDKFNSSMSQPQGTGRLDSGLAGYWKLDDGSGTTANDDSTNNNDGTLTNSPTWTTGQIGGAVQFDGTDDYITITPTAAIKPQSNITLSAWVKRSGSGENDYIFWERDSVVQEEGIFFYYGTDNKLHFVFRVTGTGYVDVASTATVTDTNWHLATVVSDASNLATFYIDGIAVGSGTTTAPNTSLTITSALLGARNGGGAPDGYASLTLDEVRFYNRALSADEVAQLYRLTTPMVVDTGLKGYWSFNGQDMSGTTAYDRSGVGNTGTLTSGPTKTIGKIGQALSFDGSDDYVDVGDMSSLEGQSAVTLSVWVKPNSLATGFQGFLSKHNNDSTNDLTLCSGGGAQGNSAVDFIVRNGSNSYGYTGTGKLVVGTWTHIVGVFDGSQSGNASRMKIYINGVDESLTFNDTIPATTPSSTTVMSVGRIGAPTNIYFNGVIDEARAYNRALSAAEVAALYNQGR